MKRPKADIDRRIVEGLHADAPRAYDASRLGALAARIERAAAPLLERRRIAGRETSWWDVAAGWAGTLIPVGVSVAAASTALLLLVHPSVVVPQPPISPRIVLGAARPAPQPDLLDFAVEEMVRPAPRQGGR